MLSSCGTTVISSAVSSSEAISEPESNIIASTADLSQPMILITSGGETISTYASILSSSSWDGEHFQCADCYPIYFPDIADRLSVVTYAEDFSIQYREDISLSTVRIYDNNFERLYFNVDLSYLNKLTEGTYYVGVVVGKWGDYIISEDQYETSSYECAFKLIVN